MVPVHLNGAILQFCICLIRLRTYNKALRYYRIYGSAFVTASFFSNSVYLRLGSSKGLWCMKNHSIMISNNFTSSIYILS